MCEYWGRGLNCVGLQLCLLQCRGFFGTCIPNFSQARNLLKWFTMIILLLVITIIRREFLAFFENFDQSFHCRHTARLYLCPMFLVISKRKWSVTFKVYRGIFSWNSSAVTEFCIVNFYIGSCVFITQNVFKLRKTLKIK